MNLKPPKAMWIQGDREWTETVMAAAFCGLVCIRQRVEEDALLRVVVARSWRARVAVQSSAKPRFTQAPLGVRLAKGLVPNWVLTPR